MQGAQDQDPARAFLEWLFPRSCSLCGETGVPYDPCTDCERSLEALLLRAACPLCAAPLAVAAPANAGTAATPVPPTAATAPCPTCLNQSPPFDRVVAPWSFVPPLSGLIHRMKYRRDLAAAAALGRLLARELMARSDFPMPDAVIGLPLSRRRLLYRGFNHAEELAAIVRGALSLGRPRRVRIGRRHSPPQARAGSAAERHANVAGTFTVHRWPSGLRHVAIVDDVLTTGATVSALAEALRAVGAERIEVWCCARTPPA